MVLDFHHSWTDEDNGLPTPDNECSGVTVSLTDLRTQTFSISPEMHTGTIARAPEIDFVAMEKRIDYKSAFRQREFYR